MSVAGTRRGPLDFNELAHGLFQRMIGNTVDTDPEPENPKVTAGRKGGEARAQALSPERRSEIARQGAEARIAAQKTE